MKYHLVYCHRAVETLRTLNADQRKLLLRWIDCNLNACDDPRQVGRALCASSGQYWKYQVGHYRILVEIQEARILIIAIKHDII